MSENFPIERLESESAKAFEAFVAYAKLGIGRTIEAAYLSKSDRSDIENNKRSHWEKWSRIFDWKGRARLYDDWLFEQVESEKMWLRKRTLVAIADQLENSLKNDLELAEMLTERLKSFLVSDKMNPILFRNLCSSFKDISMSKAKVLDAYFTISGAEALAKDLLKRLTDEN